MGLLHNGCSLCVLEGASPSVVFNLCVFVCACVGLSFCVYVCASVWGVFSCWTVCTCVSVLTVFFACAGSIADCVSKWVFRQRLSPERLRDILGAGPGSEEVKKQKEEKEDVDGTDSASSLGQLHTRLCVW